MSDSPLEYEEGTYTLQEICYKHPPPVIVNLSEDCGRAEENLDLSNPLLIYRQRNINKVTAHNVQRELYREAGPPLLIPEDYKGWFAVLHKKQVNPVIIKHDVMEFKLVSELSNSDTETFLIGGSEQVNALQMSISVDGKSQHLPRSIFPGEVLRRGKIYVGQTKRKSGLFRLKSKMKQEYYLLCTDDCEREILLPFNEKGVFYTLTTQSDRMKCPVMQMKDIIDKKILPATVKLLFGRIPSINCTFTGILRLDHSHFERSVIACTMSDRNGFMELPLSSPLSFKIVDMNNEVISSEVYKKAYTTCNEKAYFYMRGIKVCKNSGDIFSDELEEEMVPSSDIIRKKKSVASSTGSSDDNRESGYIEMRDSLDLSDNAYVDMNQVTSNKSTIDLDDMDYVLPTQDRISRHDSLRRTRSSCRSPPPTCSPPPLPTSCQGPFHQKYGDSGISDPPRTTRSSARIDQVHSDQIYDIPRIPRRLSAPDAFDTYSIGVRKLNSLEILDESAKGESIKYENFSILREVVPKLCEKKVLNRQKKVMEPFYDDLNQCNRETSECVRFNLEESESIDLQIGTGLEDNQSEQQKKTPQDDLKQLDDIQTDTTDYTSTTKHDYMRQEGFETDEQETRPSEVNSFTDDLTCEQSDFGQHIREDDIIETLVTNDDRQEVMETSKGFLKEHLKDDADNHNSGSEVSDDNSVDHETDHNDKNTCTRLYSQPEQSVKTCNELLDTSNNENECNENIDSEIDQYDNDKKDGGCTPLRTENIISGHFSPEKSVELEENPLDSDSKAKQSESSREKIVSSAMYSKHPLASTGDNVPPEDDVSKIDSESFDHLYIEILDTEMSSLESIVTPPPTACSNRTSFYHRIDSQDVDSNTDETNNEMLDEIPTFDGQDVQFACIENAPFEENDCTKSTEKLPFNIYVEESFDKEESKIWPIEHACITEGINDSHKSNDSKLIYNPSKGFVGTVDDCRLKCEIDLYDNEEQTQESLHFNHDSLISSEDTNCYNSSGNNDTTKQDSKHEHETTAYEEYPVDNSGEDEIVCDQFKEVSVTTSAYVSESTQTDYQNNHDEVTDYTSDESYQQTCHDSIFENDTTNTNNDTDGNAVLSHHQRGINHSLNSNIEETRNAVAESTGSDEVEEEDDLSRMTANEIVSCFKKLGIKRNVTDIVTCQNLKGSDLKDLHKLTDIFPGISCVDRRKISMFLQGMMQSDSRSVSHDDLQPVWV